MKHETDFRPDSLEYDKKKLQMLNYSQSISGNHILQPLIKKY